VGQDGSTINPGSFGIIQLYHITDCGDIDEPDTFREFWGITTKTDVWGLPIRRKVWRGPIFSANGSTKPDWDPLFRIPIFVMTVDEAYQDEQGRPLHEHDMYSGRVIEVVKYFLKRIEDRVMDSAVQKGEALDSHMEDMSDEMGDYLWREANQSYQTHVNMAKKHIQKRDLRDLHEYEAGKRSLKDIHLPPKPPKRGRSVSSYRARA